MIFLLEDYSTLRYEIQQMISIGRGIWLEKYYCIPPKKEREDARKDN
jgi:hypothetical protein